MKTFVAALVVFALLVTGVTVYGAYITRQTKNLQNLSQAAACALAVESADAVAKFEKTEQTFLKNTHLFCAFSVHDDVEKLEEHLKYARAHLKSGNLQGAAVEMQLFSLKLSHFAENSQIKWYTIL